MSRSTLGRSYWSLLAASALGNVGDGIAVIALPWYASTITDDPLAVAAVAAAGRLPWLMFALLAGVVGDRVDRRRLMIFAAGVKAGALTGLVLLVALDVQSIPLVMALALLTGTCEVFYDNTSQSLIPALIARDHLERANGNLYGVEVVTNQFIGPPLGGLLITGSLAFPFGVQAALIAAAVVLLTTLRGDFRPRHDVHNGHNPQRVRAMLLEGLRWLWAHNVLRPLAIVVGVINGVSSAGVAIVVLYAREVLGLSSIAFGLTLAAGALGGILSSQLAPPLTRRIPTGTTILLIVVAQACLFTAIGAAPYVWVFAAATALLGFTDIWWSVATVSLRQRIVPDHLLSRVNSAYRTVAWGSIPIGATLGGIIVTLAEPGVGRDWALRLPYLLAGATVALLVIFVRRTLTAGLLHATQSATDNRP